VFVKNISLSNKKGYI